MVQLILSQILNMVSNHGSSALLVAIQHSQVEAVRSLLAKEPKPSLLTGGYTDLHCALHEGNSQIISMLLNYSPIVSSATNICVSSRRMSLNLPCAL